jgi:4-amino-4-deoxy-L-arabinose transferase-like glycosyltransferase
MSEPALLLPIAKDRTRIWATIFLTVLPLLVLINGLVWMHVIPSGSAPDEANHARIVQFIAEHHRLPVLNRDIFLTPLPVLPDPYVTHPPGGYLISAALSVLPAQREDIRLRYGSLFCLLLAIPFIFDSARRLFPETIVTAMAITCICVSIPQVTFIGAYVNSDAFGLLAGAIWIWATIAGVQGRWTLMHAAIWGAAAGLMILGRYNGFVLLPIFGVVGLISQRRDPVLRILVRGTVAFLVMMLIAGWWLDFNYRTYHELMPIRTLWRAQTAVLGRPYPTPRDQGQTYWSLLTRSIWFSSTFRSFFGNFDWLSIPLPEHTYRFLRWMVLISGAGLLLAAARKVRRWRNNQTDFLDERGLLIGSFVVAVFGMLAFALHFALTVDFQGQGRYLFPGLIATGVLLVAGWREFFAASLRIVVAPALAIFFIALNLYSLVFLLIPYYRPLSPMSLIPQFQTVPSTLEEHILRIYRHHLWEYAFFQQSGRSVDLTETVRGPTLAMEIGVMPEVYFKCPAVRFIVSIHDGPMWRPIFDRTIRPRENAADRQWQTVLIDTSQYVNRTTQLRFTVDPAGDTAYDWAVWVDPEWSMQKKN